MAKYRSAVIGLGWMGLLYDLASRIPDRFEIGDTDRPTPRSIFTAGFNTTSTSETRVVPPRMRKRSGTDPR